MHGRMHTGTWGKGSTDEVSCPGTPSIQRSQPEFGPWVTGPSPYQNVSLWERILSMTQRVPDKNLVVLHKVEHGGRVLNKVPGI